MPSLPLSPEVWTTLGFSSLTSQVSVKQNVPITQYNFPSFQRKAKKTEICMLHYLKHTQVGEYST